MNYQTMTTDQLLKHVEVLIATKASGSVSNQLLNQRGLDWLNTELSTIEAELDNRRPEGEFIDVYDGFGEWIGFEPVTQMERIIVLPLLMTQVIKGEFLYGEKKERCTVAPFRAGIYPVTNAQFASFIEAGGYQNQRWWNSNGWQWQQREAWSQPRLWNNSRFNQPDQPVVDVSWYEAEAFCNWLSETYGQPYRLPTEVEWERLARGQDGREYPWGNDWQEGLANTHENRIGQTSTVGLFPGGISPAGAYDCAGNVWEWCADWYDEKQTDRVLRGGSWYNDVDFARCASRGRDHPSYWDYSVGFRVVVSPITLE